MCSIVGSFSKDTFIELLNLNRYRGAFSHSLTLFRDKETLVFKGFGEFNLALLDNVEPGDYLLGHCQAPTNGLVRDYDRIHPCVTDNVKLLHNGIIKKQEVDRLNEQLNTKYSWDTQVLCDLVGDSFQKLSEVEGSFACACIKKDELFLFRNAIAPLYLDNLSNISSTKIPNSAMILHNTVYVLQNGIFVAAETFNNTHNPYYF